jgi:hypothetical protein
VGDPGCRHGAGRAGSCTVTASQAGLDAYDIAAGAPVPYYPAPDVSRTFAIAKAGQTIDFAPIPNKTFGVDDGDFDVSATASSGLPVSFAAAGPCAVSRDRPHHGRRRLHDLRLAAR